VRDDLLRYVFGPQPYSVGWLWTAVLLICAVIAWYTTVFVWTLPSHQLRRIPVVRRMHGRVIRSRFARCVQRIADEHDAGRMSSPAACAAISRTLRSFLHQATGARAQYLQLSSIAEGDLAAAAPLLARLGDAQFDADARVDVTDVSSRAQELIHSWT
jgi:hypothetical protein